MECPKCKRTNKEGAFTCENCGAILSIQVKVVDIDIPFASMVVFMVKWVIATIPAAIILAIFLALIFGIFSFMPLLGLRH